MRGLQAQAGEQRRRERTDHFGEPAHEAAQDGGAAFRQTVRPRAAREERRPGAAERPVHVRAIPDARGEGARREGQPQPVASPGAAQEDTREDVCVGRLQRRRGCHRQLDLPGPVLGVELFDRQPGVVEVSVHVVHEGGMLEQRGEAIGGPAAAGHAFPRGVERHELDLRGREDLEPVSLRGRLLAPQRAARAERERLPVLVRQLGGRPCRAVRERDGRVQIRAQPHVADHTEARREGDGIVDTEDHPDGRGA